MRVANEGRFSYLAQAMEGRAARAAGYGALAGIFTFLVIGIPTDLIPNPVFGRSVPARPIDYWLLAATVILSMLLGAAYALPASCPWQEGKVTAGGVLSFLAVGCPACNKIVVLLVGAGGALRYFQPIQPILGIVSLALLTLALITRLRTVLPAPVRLDEGAQGS